MRRIMFFLSLGASSLLAAVAAFCAAPPAADAISVTESAGAAKGDRPSLMGLPAVGSAESASAPFREGISRRHAGRNWLAASDYWGGVYTTPRGAQVRMYASPWFRYDPTWLQG